MRVPLRGATQVRSIEKSLAEEFKAAVADRMIQPPSSFVGEAAKDEALEKVVDVAAEAVTRIYKLPGE